MCLSIKKKTYIGIETERMPKLASSSLLAKPISPQEERLGGGKEEVKERELGGEKVKKE